MREIHHPRGDDDPRIGKPGFGTDENRVNAVQVSSRHHYAVREEKVYLVRKTDYVQRELTRIDMIYMNEMLNEFLKVDPRWDDVDYLERIKFFDDLLLSAPKQFT